MTTKNKVESVIRNVWLAGLGTIESQREALVESFDKAQDKSQELYNELLDKGEKVQEQLEDKFDEQKQKIKDQSNKYFDLQSKENSIKQDEQLDRLLHVVDELTEKVTVIVDKRLQDIEAKATAVKKAKQTAKKITEATASVDKASKTAKPVVKKDSTKK